MFNKDIGVDEERKFFLCIFRPSGLGKNVFFDDFAAELEIRRSTVGHIAIFGLWLKDLLRCFEHSPRDGVSRHIFWRFFPESA